jgi:hypothetical protein
MTGELEYREQMGVERGKVGWEEVGDGNWSWG